MLPEEIWRSDFVPVSRQFRGFQDALDQVHYHWDLKADTRGSFRSQISRRRVNNFQFTRIIADPIKGSRTPKNIHRDQEDFFCLCYLEAGRAGFQQGSNETLITPNRVAIWDSTRPAMFDASEALCQVSLLLPHQTGTAMVPGIEDMCGTSIDGSVGLGALLLSHLKQLHVNIDLIENQHRAAVLRATMELIGAAFRPELEVGGSSVRRATLRRVQDYILVNLSDPSLSPASVAAKFRFSPRYLHRLFEETECTVGGWIRKRRLLAGKSALADCANDGISITEIAMRYGFSDQSHFCHAFRQEFGLPPRDFRKTSKSTR